jgi:hypothetical protein
VLHAALAERLISERGEDLLDRGFPNEDRAMSGHGGKGGGGSRTCGGERRTSEEGSAAAVGIANSRGENKWGGGNKANGRREM